MVLPVPVQDDSILSRESKKISELSRFDVLSSSDFFAVERSVPAEVQYEILREELGDDLQELIICLESEEDGRNQYLINEARTILNRIRIANTVRISFDDLTRQVASLVSAVFDFGPMSREDKRDYAKAWHQHDGEYSYTTVSPTYLSGVSAVAVVESVADGRSSEVSVCLPAGYGEVEPIPVGEIRFVANPLKKAVINPYADGFDGWVYADGSSYQASDFPDAYEVFNPGHFPEGQFSVPCLSDFIRLGGFGSAESPVPFQHIRYQNAISEHSHPDIESGQLGDIKSVKAEVDLPIRYSGGGSTAPSALHTSYEYPSGRVLSALSVSVNAIGLRSSPTTTLSIGNDVESFPFHQQVPAVVYIGRRQVT